jgi:hypothetical protein
MIYCVTSAPNKPMIPATSEMECAVAYFGTEAIIALGLGMFMEVASGEVITIDRED